MAHLHPILVSRFLMTSCLLGGLLACVDASAGGLEVSPTSLQITSQQSADGITLRNVGTTPMHAQVRVFAWSQKDNEDLLTPSNGVTVSPPMLQIAPGTSQLLRVIRTGTSPTPGTELTYRLIIDEIPAAATAPNASVATSEKTEAPRKVPANALSFYMRYSLPIFVGDTNDAPKTQLSWRLEKTAKEWTITANNTGGNRAQIADIQAVLPDDKRQELLPGLVGYVLAGQTRHWSFPAPDNAKKMTRLEAMVNRDVQPLHVSEP